jgi:hypothetical protein
MTKSPGKSLKEELKEDGHNQITGSFYIVHREEQARPIKHEALHSSWIAYCIQSRRFLANTGNQLSTYRGKRYDVNLKVFLMFIIGDTKGHDKLCGRYSSRALQVKRACHHCDIPTMDCDNAFYQWRHVKPDVVHSLVVSNDLEGLQAMP